MSGYDAAIAYWRMEGSSNDSKGSFNGSDVDITYGYAYGKYGKGISCNGSSSIINLGDTTIIGSTYSQSITAWIKLANSSQNAEIIQLNTNVDDNSMRIYYNSGSIYASRIKQNVGDEGIGTALSDTSNWHHVGLTYNGSVLKIYLDGNYINSVSANGNGSSFDSNRSSIGGSYTSLNAAQRWFSGYIDEVAIFDTVLSDSEMLDLYNFVPPTPTFIPRIIWF